MVLVAPAEEAADEEAAETEELAASVALVRDPVPEVVGVPVLLPESVAPFDWAGVAVLMVETMLEPPLVMVVTETPAVPVLAEGLRLTGATPFEVHQFALNCMTMPAAVSFWQCWKEQSRRPLPKSTDWQRQVTLGLSPTWGHLSFGASSSMFFMQVEPHWGNPSGSWAAALATKTPARMILMTFILTDG